MSFAQRAAEFLENVNRWRSQLEYASATKDKLYQQYDSITGVRTLGEIFDNPVLRDFIPPDWQDVHRQIGLLGKEGLTPRARGIYDAMAYFDQCASLTSPQRKAQCETRAVKAAQDKAFALDAMDSVTLRMDQIDQLQAEINRTDDQMKINGLQARIAIEQSQIAVSSQQIDLYAMAAAAEDRMMGQRAQEIDAEVWASRKGVVPPPPAW